MVYRKVKSQFGRSTPQLYVQIQGAILRKIIWYDSRAVNTRPFLCLKQCHATLAVQRYAADAVNSGQGAVFLSWDQGSPEREVETPLTHRRCDSGQHSGESVARAAETCYSTNSSRGLVARTLSRTPFLSPRTSHNLPQLVCHFAEGPMRHWGR